MPLYLVRSGSNGEFEQRFLDESRIYFNWSELSTDMSSLSERPHFYKLFADTYGDSGWSKGKQENNARQAIQFVERMNLEDWIVMPSKHNPTLHFGKITGEYEFHSDGEDRFQHSRKVEWFAPDIPRDRFDQDILYSMGAFLTICRIKRNNAEARIQEMAKNKWHVPKHSSATLGSASPLLDDEDETIDSPVDLEQTAYDQISRLILAKFKGHGLADLTKAILEAQNYAVHQPAPGPDHGVDLLASSGPLGFGEPRICV